MNILLIICGIVAGWALIGIAAGMWYTWFDNNRGLQLETETNFKLCALGGPIVVVKAIMNWREYKETMLLHKHPTSINGYRPHELAELVSRMRYDALAEFLDDLQSRLITDSRLDMERGRSKLARHLRNAADSLETPISDIQSAWAICKHHMKN